MHGRVPPDTPHAINIQSYLSIKLFIGRSRAGFFIPFIKFGIDFSKIRAPIVLWLYRQSASKCL